MRRKPRIILFTSCGLVILLALLLVALPRLLDLDAYREQLAAQVSQASGLQVRIGGELALRLALGLKISVTEVQLTSDGEDVASIEKLGFGIDLLPLLRREVRINSIEVQSLLITITRAADGSLNIAMPVLQESSGQARNLKRVVVTDSSVHYTDLRADTSYEALDCSIEASNLRLTGGSRAELLSNLALAGELACTELRRDEFTINDLEASASASRGELILDPVSMTLFGASGAGSLQANFSGELPGYEIHYSLPQFNIEELFSALGSPETVSGSVDFEAMLTMGGSTVDTIRQSMAGQVSLQGRNLTLAGIDLDEEFASFASSQNFSLVDVGALFFAGPLGLMMTKGYDFVSILQNTGTQSDIRALVSDWTLSDGVGQAQDVAMVTDENRLALKGEIDFRNGQFNDLTFALVDANGCPIVEQLVHGSFQEPEIETPNVLIALAGPVLSLLEQGLELVSDEDCVPFYEGSLPARQ